MSSSRSLDFNLSDHGSSSSSGPFNFHRERILKLPRPSSKSSSPKKKVSKHSSHTNSAFENFKVDPWDCPLCMEPVDLSDLNFTPCECGYQVCRFCWHHIKSVLNDLCPACRRSYSQQLNSPLVFIKPASDLSATSSTLKGKVSGKKKSASESSNADHIISLDSNGTRGGAPLGNVLASRKHLIDIRVLQSNLVYVVGIPLSFSLYHLESLASSKSVTVFSPIFISALENLLTTKEYFGKYGTILKLVINVKGHHSESQSTKRLPSGLPVLPTVSAFLTFAKPEDAGAAIENIDHSTLEGYPLRATYGTTKYCASFLRGQTCPNQTTCLYLHELGDIQNSYTKETLSHRQRDISLKRLFGAIPKSITDLPNSQKPLSSSSPRPEESSSINTTINIKPESYNSPNIGSNYSELKESFSDLTSFPEAEKDAIFSEHKKETSQNSVNSTRSSSRFTFVSDLSLSDLSIFDTLDTFDKTSLDNNLPFSKLFEAFKTPNPQSPANLTSSLDSNTPSTSKSTSWYPLGDIENPIATIPKRIEHTQPIFPQKAISPSNNQALQSYSAVAKSSPVNIPSNTSSPNPIQQIKKSAESKITVPNASKSTQTRKLDLNSKPTLKSRNNSTANPIREHKKENEHKQASRDYNESRTNSRPSSISSFSPQPIKLSNPFMFLKEEDPLLLSDFISHTDLNVNTNKSVVENLMEPSLKSNAQKNSKKKKKNTLDNELNDNFTEPLEIKSSHERDSERVTHTEENLDQKSSDLHETFSVVISYIASYLDAVSTNALDPSIFHYIDNMTTGDHYALNSLYYEISMPSELESSQYLLKFFSQCIKDSDDMNLFSDNLSLIDTICTEIQEFDFLASLANEPKDISSVQTNNIPPNDLSYLALSQYSFDIYSDINNYAWALPKLLISLLTAFDTVSWPNNVVKKFSDELTTETSSIEKSKAKVEKTLALNSKFSGLLELHTNN